MKTKRLFLNILLVMSVVSVYSQDFTEKTKLVAPDRSAMDQFGNAVSISDSFAIIGAYYDSENAAGQNVGANAGSAYIFERDGSGNWNQGQKISGSDVTNGDNFGYSVAISGNYAIVGAYQEGHDAQGQNFAYLAGSAYIFERDSSGKWNQVQKIVASDRANEDYFGCSVSISGNYAFVGAFLEDEDEQGLNTIIGQGSAYIFKRNDQGTWTQIQKIVASDRSNAVSNFCQSVDISGNYAIVGASSYTDASGGNTVLLAGAAYIYRLNESEIWEPVQKVVASDRQYGDGFGNSVALSGNYAIIGAKNEDDDVQGNNAFDEAGSAYAFERNGSGTWEEVKKLVAFDRNKNDFFGNDVDISGNYAVIGAYSEDENVVGGDSLDFAGSIYVFQRNGTGNWNEVQKIVASDRAAYDNFGYSVAISVNNIIAGAWYENEDAAGANTKTKAGSAYIFKSETISDLRKKGGSDIIKAYPNPTNDYLIISGANGSAVKLVNGMGVVLNTYFIRNEQISIDVKGLPKGSYVIAISNGDAMVIEKVLVY